MPHATSIQPDKDYTFSDYFKLDFEPEDVLSYFGYEMRSESLTLPKSSIPLPRLFDLRDRLQRTLPHISLNNETARREFLIAPVLMELVDLVDAKLKVSYTISVDRQLKGSLDYFLETKRSLLVIEAKDENLQRGFVQLATELIALDRWLDTDNPILYGAVSIGSVWQFSCLHRLEKLIVQDLNLFRAIGDLEELIRILIGILE
jgi:hypothetical protein